MKIPPELNSEFPDRTPDEMGVTTEDGKTRIVLRKIAKDDGTKEVWLEMMDVATGKAIAGKKLTREDMEAMRDWNGSIQMDGYTPIVQ
jgi:hypothetical protein